MVSASIGLTQILAALIDLFPQLIAFCAIIAAIIPPANGGFLGWVYRLINTIAMNVGHARNYETGTND
jgi:hypothetical protein